MSNEINFILTNSAAELISKVLNGKTLNFTRMAVGDGFSYNTEIAKGFTTVVNEVLSLDITKKEILSPSSIKITSAFKSTDAQKEFYYREVGLYAEDPDTGQEVLYAYGNRNDAAELIIPTGANIVTKQLIFIVSVGDSANVTFNVNADVYALQEDMLDVQENKADKNLANTGMITNCLLEVPQRIKYELSNGILTIKAGSVLIFPYGTEAPTLTIGSKFFNSSYKVVDYQYKDGKLFYWVEMQSDKVISYVNIDPNLMLTFNSGGSHAIAQSQYCTSGTEAPTAQPVRQFWYDQIRNFIYNYTLDSVVADSYVVAFPILLANCTAIDVFSLNQVFNGMGYIGSTIWVDKGVKGLIPNGRNQDGSLNNLEYTVPSITLMDCSGEYFHNIDFFVNTKGQLGHNFLFESENINSNSAIKTYVPSQNKIFSPDNSSNQELFLARGTIWGEKFTLFKPYATFNAVDKSSDKAWLSSLSMPSEKYIDYDLGERGTTYTAPANGWFAIRKDAGFINAQVSLAVWDYDETFEFFRTTMSSPAENVQIAFFVPILKGQKLAVDYDATGLTIYFRFIYAEGEVN